MIIVAGDSYCGFIRDGTWPYQLAKELEMTIKQYSNSGGSWWATRRSLIKAKNAGELDDAKVVVLCHTEGTRIPNIDDIPIGGWVVENQPNWYAPKILAAAKMYYEHLHDPSFAEWTQQAWLDECVDLFPKDTIIIHMHSFSYSYLKLKISNGVNVFPPLFALTQSEFLTDKEGFDFISKNGDSRLNHLNTANNIALGKDLANIVKEGVKEQFCLNLDTYQIKNIELIKQHSSGTGDIMYKGKII